MSSTQNGTAVDSQISYDPFAMATVAATVPTPQFNPYLEDGSGLAGAGAAYFQTQNAFAPSVQPVSYI
jgi:PAB-dependent poly(A)-specific ribonuclease subunit 3